MALEKFSLQRLTELDDGRIRVAFDQAVRRCIADCADRPGMKGARKVTLTVLLDPVLDEEAGLDSCDVRLEINEALPKRKSRIYNMTQEDGALFYNELSPSDAHQQTIDQAEGDEPKPLQMRRDASV